MLKYNLLHLSLQVESPRVRVSLRLTVSQSVCLGVEPTLRTFDHLTRYCFLFKSLGLEFVILSLWGALSDEKPGLSFKCSYRVAVKL
jgi:hypothetical protein